MSEKKPPLGLMNEKLHAEQRYLSVCSAISRYYNAGLKIPIEWVEEHNKLIERLSDETSNRE